MGRAISILPLLHVFVYVAGFSERMKCFFLPLEKCCFGVPRFKGQLREWVLRLRCGVCDYGGTDGTLPRELVCPMASFECPFPLGVAVEYVSKAGLGSLEFSYNIGKIEF